jgi:RNA polymerase sigma-70 factor (ECF subfamily)
MVLGPEHGDVDDVTQEATIGLLGALPRFRGECTVAQFAGRVAVLTAMAARRRQRTRQRWVVTDDDASDCVSSSPESSPFARIETVRRREVVRRLVDELPEAIGEAMVLYFMLGHTAEEIAAMTHVPVNTVWSRVRLGKARLRQKIEDDPLLREALDASEGGR